MNHNKQVAVIIPAAGKAMRFGASKPKQYHLLGEDLPSVKIKKEELINGINITLLLSGG